MGRPRMALANQVKHLTNQEKQRQAAAEAEIKTGSEELFDVTDEDFVSAKARKEYERVLGNLKNMSLIGNLDKAHLIRYANAYANAAYAKSKLKKEGYLDEKGNVSPWNNLYIKYGEEVRASARLCGIAIDSRLKAAFMKNEKTKEQIAEKFGDI